MLSCEGGDRRTCGDCRHLAGHAPPDAGPGFSRCKAYVTITCSGSPCRPRARRLTETTDSQRRSRSTGGQREVNSRSTKVITGSAGSPNGKVAGNTPHNTHHNTRTAAAQQAEGAPCTRSAPALRVRTALLTNADPGAVVVICCHQQRADRLQLESVTTFIQLHASSTAPISSELDAKPACSRRSGIVEFGTGWKT